MPAKTASEKEKEEAVYLKATDEDFERVVIKGSFKMPVVVDFHAEWCTPCHMLAPVLEKLARELKGKFMLVKVNTDANPATASAYHVSAIPLVKMFKSGEVVAEFVGFLPEEDVREWLLSSF